MRYFTEDIAKEAHRFNGGWNWLFIFYISNAYIVVVLAREGGEAPSRWRGW